ncbi:hypothetical protein LTS16_000893 [Friedmanniomyces endolithicus]|nr:hypothetical protein LTS00_001268 [Friedmanniomyces endolithicus]KAK0999968.1 hypothetical protein LTR54_008891 [Friedmanniomyces endolithicus]KAK1053862.1 hypothetical protein LTS16_000893 [Friedmanniomyces endolithicus]
MGTNEGGNGVPTRTISIVLWAILTGLWSIFTPPHHTFAVRALLMQPAWLLRAIFRDPTWLQDLALFLPLSAFYGFLVGHWHFFRWTDFHWLHFRDETMRLYFQIFALLAMCSLFAGGIVFRGRRLQPKETDEPLHEQRIDEQVLPPLLLPSIPVGMHGHISRLLSVDTKHPGWFHVDSADHLDRGHEGSSLAEKLNSYLHSQGVTDRDYAFAYLVTAPRFLGYSFNPVSFWYLYDSDTKLKYMILEVNNTFDERRMYLLKGDAKDVDILDELDRPHNSATKPSKQLVFTDSWTKDFHVSPFNSRKGSYSLRATDPLAEYEQTGQVRIDNTIVLCSSKEHPKLVARVFSEGEAKDPSSISVFETARFIVLWCWVGFATLPRIVWQAAKLSLRRKLHVWYRPEVTDASVGRPYTGDEKQLEAFFRAFVAHVVYEASDPLRIVYEPAHSEGYEVVFYSPSFTYEEDHKRTLSLNVLSPAFYSRFVHYTDWDSALDFECRGKDEKNRTARLEGTADLPEPPSATDNRAQAGSQQQAKTKSFGLLDQVRWACLRRLRCPPVSSAYAEGTSGELQVPAISHSTPSELDDFVRTHCNDANVYRRITTKLFLAQRLCFGIPALLDIVDYLLRTMLLLASMIYSDHTQRPVDMFRWRQLGTDDLGAVACMLLLANSIHVWSFIKA